MAHPYHHALSSVRKWGGQVEDYLPIHNWFDSTKAHMADFRHRALRHHAEGIFLMESIFGMTLENGGRRLDHWSIGARRTIVPIAITPSTTAAATATAWAGFF